MPRAHRAAASAAAVVDLEEAFPHAIVISRWLLVLAVTALVVFGNRQAPALLPDFALIGAMVLSNVAVAWLRTHGARWKQLLELITVVDVLVITLVISWVDPSPQTYLAVFAALILASALGRVGLVMVMMLLVCGAYSGYLYTEIGTEFWRQVPLVLRVPFLFAIGLHFATIASYLKTEKARSEDLILTARQHAERADHLAKEQDRLRALSQIGRLGLTAADAHPVKVLLEIAHRAQRALGAHRCSLILFARADQGLKWEGHSKDRSIEVRTLPIETTALDAILLDGKMTEVQPDSKELLANVKAFFPDSNPYGSLLVAPVISDDATVGALFLIDGDNRRKYNDGERDFFWTASLMTGAFIQARERLENELRLRTLITNAPVIMFALGSDGTVRLFEGRGTAALRKPAAQFVGKSLFSLVGNPEETREACEKAGAGRMVTGTLAIDGMLFETQFSPLRGVDGTISGVMGVTTALLDAPPPKPRPAAPAAASTATPGGAVSAGTPAVAPGPKIPLADEAPPRTPKIPLADEPPPRTPKFPLADEAPPRTPKIPLADEAPPPTPKFPLADEAPPRTPKIPLADEAPARTPKIPLADEAAPQQPQAPQADEPAPPDASRESAAETTAEIEKAIPEWWTDRIQ